MKFGNCGTVMPDAAVEKRRSRGETTIVCFNCETRVSLDDYPVRADREVSGAVRAIDEEADARRLREAAQLRLDHKHDAVGALADLARAFPLAPRDQLIENQLQALAKATGDFTTLGIAYLEAIGALGDDDGERLRQRRQEQRRYRSAARQDLPREQEQCDDRPSGRGRRRP